MNMIVVFIQNAAVLVTLTVFYGVIKWYRFENKYYYKLFQGALFGVIAIASMMMPYEYDTGMIYDGRSVILALAGFWGGAYTATFSAIIAGVYRASFGGAGMWAGLATIVLCSMSGYLIRQMYKKKVEEISFFNFWMIGIVVHLVMLVSQFLLPGALEIILHIAIPVLLVFPLTFAFISKIIQIIDQYIIDEQNLRDAEALYRSTLMSIGDAVICTNKRGQINQMNTVAEQLTGWDFSDARGKFLEKVFNIINEFNRGVVENPFNKVIESGKIVDLANHALLLSKDGREIPIADSGAPIKNEKGEITGVVLVFRDQTRDREVERKIAKSEAQYRELVESTDAIAWEYDIGQDKWVYVAPQISEKTDWQPEEWTNLDFWKNNVHPDERENVTRYCLACSFKGEKHSLEYRFRKKNGGYIWIRDVVSVEKKNNKPVKLRGVMFDITERKNIEKHLQESEERFSKSILLAPIPIMVHDEDGKVINISQGWTQFSGYTPEDIPTIKIWAEKAYRDNATEVENYIAGLFDGEETIESGEFEIFSKSGEKRIWNFHTTPLGRLKSGKKIMLSIAPDITEKKKLLNELVAAKEKAEESDHLKTAFLANMSHEIRTPMNAIMGFSSLLPEEDNMENISKYSGIIVKNSEYLVRLIDDLMLYSKLQTNMLQYNPVKFNVRELFDDVLQVFKMKQQEQGIPLKIESETDLSFSINTDYDKLKQLLTNLISNAFKYTVEGSITLGADLEKDKFLFYIKDTGIGIPQKEASKVFDRFYRAGNAVDSSIGGTGLGLSIVAELATLIGGKVWFESKQGEGTTFYVSL